MSNGRLIGGAVAALVALAVAPPGIGADGNVLIVGPGGFEEIQDAVDAASEGDTILIKPGTYQEAVTVTVPRITIMGESRDAVVLDGGATLSNGFTIAVDGVTIRSLTVRDYTSNGVAFSGVTGFYMYDLHAIDNRVYGLYAIHSTTGEIAFNEAEGSGDGGLYIGETVDCDCDVHHNYAHHNALGYSGTANSRVRIWENEFAFNRAGIVMSVLPNEMGVEEDGTFYGSQVRGEIHHNWVHDNNFKDSPVAGFTETVNVPYGMGIDIAGGWFNDVHDNLVEDNLLWGIAMHWLTLPPRGNYFHDNVISGSRVGIWWDEMGEDQCFVDNVITNVEKVSDPDPLPTCPGPVGDLPCPEETTDWLACRASDVRAPSALKLAELAWRSVTEANHDEDLVPSLP